MLPFTRSQWTRIAQLLDVAFNLSDEGRIAWIAQLEKTHPDLAGPVELLLDVHHTCTATNFPPREPLVRTVLRISLSLGLRDTVIFAPAPGSCKTEPGPGNPD